MNQKRKPHIEIILPVYNEQANILPLMEELDSAAQSLSGRATVSYLFINDGSVDGTTELLKKLFHQHNNIRVVNLIHNFGHASAISCGIHYFSGDIACLMDADLQDSPKALKQMFEAWEKGAKTVVAERGKRQEKAKLLFKTFYYLLHKAAPSLTPIAFGTHCLLDKTVVARLRLLAERNRYFPGLVSFASSEIVAVRVDRESRVHGKSRVGYLGLVRLAITALVSFSSLPINLVSILGIICAGGAITVGLVIIGIKLLTNAAIPGWASQMTTLTLGSGMQLLCLGIIGQYISRIYDEVKQRPLYIVKDTFNRNEAPDLLLESPQYSPLQN